MRPVGSSRKSNCNRRKQSWTGPSFTLFSKKPRKPTFVRFFMVPEAIEEDLTNPMNSRKTSPIAPALHQNCCINKGAEWNRRWLVSLRCVPPLLLAFLWIVLFLSLIVIVPAPPFVFRRKVPCVFKRVSSYPFFWGGHGNHTLLTILSEYHPQR